MTYYTGKDLARSFRVVRKNTIQVAEEIPESSYGFRAAPDTRTVAETLAHVAAGPRWQRVLHGDERKTFVSFEDFGRYMADVGAYEATLTTRAAILDALARDGEALAAWLESLTEDMLGEIVSFPPPVDPPTKSRFELLLGIKEHEMHHRAQLMVVERLLGIVPHLTRARQARS
jgi:uncharacterized damage-inducible protein DinB